MVMPYEGMAKALHNHSVTMKMNGEIIAIFGTLFTSLRDPKTSSLQFAF